MTPLPGSVSFKVVCPELGLIIDIEFDGHSLVSTVVANLIKMLRLNGTEYYLTNGQLLDPRLPLQEAIRDGTSCLLLNYKDRGSLLNRNLELAVEGSPESFSSSPKKFLIEVGINGYRMKGFLDSGAMHSILPLPEVASCGLATMVDDRFDDEARGIGGSQPSAGKIFHCPLAVAGEPMPTSFLVMDAPALLLDKDEVLLGIDFIQKYVKAIDFQESRVMFKSGSEARALNWK